LYIKFWNLVKVEDGVQFNCDFIPSFDVFITALEKFLSYFLFLFIYLINDLGNLRRYEFCVNFISFVGLSKIILCDIFFLFVANFISILLFLLILSWLYFSFENFIANLQLYIF